MFTNGLVKAPDSLPDIEMLGPTVGHDGRTDAVDLFADPRDAGPGRLNGPFRAFAESLDHSELRQLFSGTGDATERPRFFHGFERTNFRIIHLRTDGERLLAFTHSGEAHVNEAYRFKVTIDADGDHYVTPQLVTAT